MNKTIWQPLVLGVVFGLMAGIVTVTGLSFIVPSSDSSNAVGFYMTLLLLAASLGGPLAGVMASTLLITISNLFGPPDMKAIISDPVIFWTNMFVVGMLVVLVGFAYRLIFDRVKMPSRLLLWAVIVIAVYIINSPAITIVQFYLLGDIDILPAILFGYKTYISQAIFDICFTSLVFIALPARYRKPLWYTARNIPDQKSVIHSNWKESAQ